MSALSFRPIKNECVVVMRGDKVAGTIRRYRAHGAVIVSVPGVLSPYSCPGECAFSTIGKAKRAVLKKEAAK